MSSKLNQERPTIETMRSMAREHYPERIVPAASPYRTFSESGMRYAFAAQFVSGRRVLDVGCGTGIGSSYLRAAGARFVAGVDISEEAVKLAHSLYPDCAFAVGDGSKLPVSAALFDLVVCFEAIEHVGNFDEFLDACHGALKAGGIFLCSTPNALVSKYMAKNPYHIREFLPTEFYHLLSCRFADIQLFAQTPVNLLTEVPFRKALSVLEVLKLRKPLEKVLSPRATRVVEDWFFKPDQLDPKFQVLPYRDTRFHKGRIIVALARKT